VVGVVLIVALAAGLGWWAYRADYQVLFAEVTPADAAAMTGELDKMKTPYQLTDGGNTILVPRELVYKTRLKLMGKDVPLHGAVGFEVFNNADFGMTEFVQKVNYLRAIQGELTRTILSIDDVQAARVHLALAEQGLFKKTGAKPKASVTITMKNGRVLASEQISGIQRLVAGSVPEIVSSDVTVLNQHGVALTRVAQGDGLENAGSQLDAKRSAEDYLQKKVTQVLDSSFGPGEAVASVDVALNLDQSKITTEEVLPAKNADPSASATGVVVREKSSSQEGSQAAAPAGAIKAGGAASNSSEFDYQVGRRVEQVVAASGSIKRMTIAVLVKQAMSEAQLAKLKEVVSLATGINGQRGDAVVVYSMAGMVNPPAGEAAPAAAVSAEPAAAPPPAASAPRNALPLAPSGLALLALAVLAFCVLAYVLVARRRPAPPAKLSAAQREQMLADVRRWINTPAGASEGGL
jgi:flagellar M-ring protein FliF